MEILYDFKQTICGIAIDSEDNIFVAKFNNNSIDKISLDNGKASITQSTNISSSPYGLAINSKNEIYIGTYKGEIMKMTKEGIISNIAGNGTRGFADGIGKDAEIGYVHGICFDEKDIAYFCDCFGLFSIRRLTTDGKVTTLCGGEKSGYSNGKGKQAEFNWPSGIVYNHFSKIFYIADYGNDLIRTMTLDGTVNTLCGYSNNLKAIAIDGEGKLYVSTMKDGSGEGEIITVDTKGEIKRMDISVQWCHAMAFNSKGDLFFVSEDKLCVIRNCTKHPPHPIIAPTINIDTKGSQSDIQEKLVSIETKLASIEAKLAFVEDEKQNKSKKRKLEEIPELESEEETTGEQPTNEVLKWLASNDLENLFPILQNIGVKKLEFLQFLQESDFEGTNIKPLQKRILFEKIKKLE